MAIVLNPLRAEIPSRLLEKKGFNNLYEMFDRSVGEDPDKSMARFKIRKGDWGSFSYREMKKGVLDSSAAMLGMGIKKGDRIAFVCKNRYEWMMLDLAIHRIGAVNVSNYVTPDPKKLVKSEIVFNINDSGSRIVFVGDDYLRKFLEMIDNGEVPSIEKVICLDEEESVGKRKDLIALSDFLRSGKKNEKLLDDYKEKVVLNDTATIIYTSGSTGVPKGVVLTHGNLLSNVENILEMVDVRHDDIELSFLPLGHVFERIISYLLVRMGGTVGYAQSIETLADDALVIKPTVFPAVPHVFEKFKAKIEANAQSKGGLSLRIYNWSLKVGSKVNKGEKGPMTMMKYGIAKKLVFDKVVKKLGGQVRFFVSSAAPLSEGTANFFKSMNFEILEAYGMTEAGPLISINQHGRERIGTVGEFPPEVECKIAKDGEIMVRAPSIMKGFWNRPDAESEAFNNGWLATGDIGLISNDEYLTITDRKKNMIKTSNGKYIPPAPIEDKLVSNMFINQALVIGDKHPHCSAIIIPDFKRLEDYAQKNNIHYAKYEDLISNPSINRFYSDLVKKETSHFANHEQPKKIILGYKEWTWESGELTPTQKVKRTVIYRTFKKEIERIYSSA